MRRPSTALISVVVTVAMATVSCGKSANIDNTSRDPRSGRIVGKGEIAAQRLRAGDCFNDSGQESTLVVTGLPCDAAHQSQVVALVELPDEPGTEWPGDGELADRSRPGCLAAAADAVGENLTDPTVGLSAYVPDQESWDSGDRRVVCVIGRFDNTAIKGSLMGSST